MRSQATARTRRRSAVGNGKVNEVSSREQQKGQEGGLQQAMIRTEAGGGKNGYEETLRIRGKYKVASCHREWQGG